MQGRQIDEAIGTFACEVRQNEVFISVTTLLFSAFLRTAASTLRGGHRPGASELKKQRALLTTSAVSRELKFHIACTITVKEAMSAHSVLLPYTIMRSYN